VVVILGPAEEEKTNLIHFWHPMLTARGLTLAQLAALLTRCRLYLGNDSGVSHLAAMLGVETIVLFGPTDPAQWAPRGKRVTVVTQQVECAPCAPSLIKACPHRKCLAALDPSNVIKALEEVLSIPADVIRIKRPS
jgi:ADP-heptose:LPS heptosyltransferase